MVGLVLVSHSRDLAEALMAFVHQVAGDQIPLAIAAGVGPERKEFGTDAVEIMEAIQSVYSDDGVLVLMDLGSAVLSAEMAYELLPPEMQRRIRFCAAPFVEGAIAAVVQVGITNDIDAICREARQALQPKEEQLGQVDQPLASGPAPAEEPVEVETEQVIVRLENAHGLHARPAARFVQLASSFDAQIQVKNLTKGKGPVSARSLNALASLAAVKGDELGMTGSGPQAREALLALKALVMDRFGEAQEAEPAPAAKPESGVQREPFAAVEAGVKAAPDSAAAVMPVADGVAVGPLFKMKAELPPVPEYAPEDLQAEWQRLQQAVEETSREIEKQRRGVAQKLGDTQAEIFTAHQLILQDPELLARARSLIFEQQHNAAKAWNTAVCEVADTYRGIEDEYLQQRATDVLDVGTQVLRILAGETPVGKIELPGPVILFARELTPTDTARLEMDKVLGVMTVAGGSTSHSAILARAMGIPAVAGVDAAIETLPDGTLVGMDGFEGRVWIEPSADVAEKLQEQRSRWLAQRQRLLEARLQPAVTRDGQHIEAAANVGKQEDAELAMQNGAEAVGLLRTEFLFLTRATPPDEEEQYQAIRAIVETMQGRPVVVRTLDVGGDKALPYIDLPQEANPFLGVRAIRLSLRRPDLFKPQLRAILRAGAAGVVRIMFPLISSLEELEKALELLEAAHQELEQEGIPHQWPVETGIMVEVPSAAILAPVFARRVDFFSIGTNDLTQYTLAAERGNPSLPELADPLHPAVLHLIRQVVLAAHQHGKWVGVCGEMAGDPAAIPVLVGLGVDELSANPVAVPQMKAIVRSLELEQAEMLVEDLLRRESAAAAREQARRFLNRLERL